MKNKKVLAFFLLVFFPPFSLQAAWIWSPEAGKFVDNGAGVAQGNADEQYDFAMRFYNQKDWSEAEKQFQDLLKKYPNSKTAPEAQYRLGTIFEEKGDLLKSFKIYRSLVENYPQSDRFNEVIEREFRIGNLFLSGRKAKIMGLEVLPSQPRAAEVFGHIIKFAPYSDFGDKAQFHLGLAYKQWGHYDEAVDAFQAVIDQYPKSPLVTQARFQLTESAFLKSATHVRDQRAMDDASKEVDKFLKRYPDSESSEKAAKLRQVIDEKNAEKNYRIALYYEKEHYIQSAIIYYGDVKSRYPDTKWGAQAAEKLKSLKEPADYLTSQQKELDRELKTVEGQLQAPAGKDNLEQDALKRKAERLKKRRKTLEKDKKDSLDTREQDLARRERELKDKFKNLDKKQKLMKNNTSEDFKRAMERWRASLMTEQEGLYNERKQLKEWKQELGVSDRKFPSLPFVGEGPSPLEKVRQIEAKKLFKLSEEKKSLLEEKELLYKHRSEVAVLLKQLGSDQPDLDEKIKDAETQGETFKSQQKKLRTTEEDMDQLERELNAKTLLYEKHYGKSMAWAKALPEVASSLSRPVVNSMNKSLDLLNPFDTHEKSEPVDLQGVLEKRMHVQEKIAAQQNLVDTLSQAFDAELALHEQRHLLADVQSDGNIDAAKLRKSVKRLEKDIRSRYEEIQDRNDHKKKLLRTLDALLKQKESESGWAVKTGRTVGAPFAGTGRFFKSFVFGLPHEEEELTKAAAKAEVLHPDSPEIRQLRQEVELEDLVIEAKSREITALQRDLETMKAKASLAGGYKFRSSLVQVPYAFVGEAIENAKRMVPKKNRQDMLIHRLNEETQKLEEYKADLKRTEKQIRDLEKVEKVNAPEDSSRYPAPAETASKQEAEEISKPAPVQAKAAEPVVQNTKGVPDEKELKSDIQGLSEKLKMQRKIYKHEKKAFWKNVESGKDLKQAEKQLKEKHKEIASLQKELRELEEELIKLIEKEKDLENQESSVLEKRINAIDRAVQKIKSKVISQDLLTERERIADRLTQISTRQDFLTKELKRFATNEGVS